jgi:hypothetical protein
MSKFKRIFYYALIGIIILAAVTSFIKGDNLLCLTQTALAGYVTLYFLETQHK